MPDLVLENVSQEVYDDLRRHGKARGAEEAEEGIAQPKEQMATVHLTPEAQDDFARLPKVIQGRVKKVLQRLQQWPAVSGAKALSANLSGFFRIRIGDYRLRFHVVGERVMVDKIGHRKDVYDD
jgi:mRNA interferase RelE/StbE